MVKYTYKGSGILTFTHEEKDYVVVHGTGTHNLPEDSGVVQSLAAQNLLIPVQSSGSAAELTDLKSKKNK
jgi:hypothetical protein